MLNQKRCRVFRYEKLILINDARLKIITSNLCQLAFNLNLALINSRFDYVMRIDADDVCCLDRLRLQLECIVLNDYDVVGSNIHTINQESRRLSSVNYPEFNQQIRGRIWFRSVLAHPSVLYKKSVVMQAGGYFGDSVSEDYDLWLRLMRDSNIKFYNIQKPLLSYRVHGGQSKGNPISFAEVSGKLFRESIIQKRITYFLGAFIYLFKALLK